VHVYVYIGEDKRDGNEAQGIICDPPSKLGDRYKVFPKGTDLQVNAAQSTRVAELEL
jgi:hypothetical protein